MESALTPIQTSSMIAFILAFIFTRFLILAHLNDSPDDKRKLHQDHKATAGGLAIVLGCGAAIIYLLQMTNLISDKIVFYVFGFALAFSIVALLDDLFTLDAKLRLGFLVLAGALIAISPLRIENLVVYANINLSLGAILGGIGTAIWLIYFVNAVNFMDGANGMAIGSLVVSLLGVAFLAYHHGSLEGAIFALIGIGASCGFLVYNVVKGNIFAGDIGAWFMGAYFAILGLFVIKIGVSPFAIALCVAPIICDTILTILYRIKIGDNILKPHNKHFYQLLIRSGRPHVLVSAIYWFMAGFCAFIANILDKDAQKFMAIGFFAICLVFMAISLALRPVLQNKITN
jgi:UDP-GlcNAc:undecaprenyl-phosphate/decaprenyl-phosphate GlcNAc-1-phosphate transferase